MDTKRALGLVIQSERKARGLSQEALAEAVGVAIKTIGNWERGITVPKGKKREALLAVLAIPEERLLALAAEIRRDVAPRPKGRRTDERHPDLHDETFEREIRDLSSRLESVLRSLFYRRETRLPT
jgi:transcriptional regulator with XRE-family HTH domain